jgi:ribosomal protein S18 acetylase RimI-like enzyme
MPAPAPEVQLRAATAADREFLLLLYAGTRADELAAVPWGDDHKRAFIAMQFEAQSRAYSAYENASQSIIVAGGSPAGRLYVERRTEEIRIIDISLLPEFRGRGIGTALLRELIAEADLHKQRISIHVERFNRALRLYTRLGFEIVADKDVYLYLERPKALLPPEAGSLGSR